MNAPAPTLTAALGTMEAKDFAAALLSGATGMSLYAAITEARPAISRADAFLGAVLAMSLREADLVAAEIELKQMRKLLSPRGSTIAGTGSDGA
jgi:hypothetical protein